MKRYHCIVWLLLAALLTSCSHRSLHEAQRVVAEADSVWQAGQAYRDSAALAQAYHTLYRWKRRYADGYVHACYHYGKLLREKDDPVTAMQAFLNATRTGSHDFHILGRVYSNIGDMCHRAEEFQLSYDMFEKSAELFLCNGDTLNYYYALNDMAYELAEQGKKEETLALLEEIETKCGCRDVIAITQETKAEMYRLIEQFDSAICCLNKMQQMGIITPTYLTIKAQSFYRLNQSDSAIIYANSVLDDPSASYQNKFNALYILSHVEDSTLTKNDIRDMDSQREDIRFYQYEPEKESLIHAVYLLQQKPSPQTNLRWLYVILSAMLTGCIIIVVYIYRKRKRHQLLTQHISDLEKRKSEALAQMRDQIEAHCSLLKTSSHITKDLCWIDFEKTCLIIDQQFYLFASKLRAQKCLNETDVRLCILVLIGFNEKTISQILPYAPNGVGKLKYRTSQKLGIAAKNLRKYLIQLAIDDPMK